MVAKKKEVEDVKERITLTNYAVKNNISFMVLVGFRAYLETGLEDLHDETELDKSYKKYLATPGFI